MYKLISKDNMHIDRCFTCITTSLLHKNLYFVINRKTAYLYNCRIGL